VLSGESVSAHVGHHPAIALSKGGTRLRPGSAGILKAYFWSYPVCVAQRSVLVVSDLHLGPTAPASTGPALGGLLRRFSDHELVVLGDCFDLSLDRPEVDPLRSVVGHLDARPEFARALRERLSAGCPVTLVVGNHDAALTSPGMADGIRSSLGLQAIAPLAIEPWCIGRFGIHLEHGHLWDPDNATSHPLAAFCPAHEPLGVTMMRRVLAPSRALGFAHAHEITPLQGIVRAFRNIGPRAPMLILRYYAAACAIWMRATRKHFGPCVLRGQAALPAFVERQGLAASTVEQLLRAVPEPRHHRRSAVFARLYLDRSLATAALLLSLPTALAGAPLVAAAGAASGSLYLGASLLRRRNRYRGVLLSRMQGAAAQIRAIAGTRAVVFGHTHVCAAQPGYANPGSFTFTDPSGRPFLVLDDRGRIHRGRAFGLGEVHLVDISSKVSIPPLEPDLRKPQPAAAE